MQTVVNYTEQSSQQVPLVKGQQKILKESLEWANIKLKDGQATVILQKIICTLEKEGYKWREGPNDTTEFAKD